MFSKSLEDRFLVVQAERSYCYSAHTYEASSYDKAEALAKKMAHRNQEDYLIFKACAHVETIVPEMKVTKLVK